MDSFITPGIISGIVGAIVAVIVVSRLNAKVRAYPCPRCGQRLGDKNPGARSMKQIFRGGWTCPNCGCDVDRHGRERSDSSPDG